MIHTNEDGAIEIKQRTSCARSFNDEKMGANASIIVFFANFAL